MNYFLSVQLESFCYHVPQFETMHHYLCTKIKEIRISFKALMFDIPTEDDFKELLNNTGFIQGQKSTRFEKGNLSNIQSLPCGFWIKGNDFSQPLYVDSNFTIRHGNINDVRCIVVLKRVGDSSK